MQDAIDTIKYKGYKIEIFQDDNTESPRDWDNLGVFHCWHRRMNLGDKNYNFDNYNSEIEYKEVLKAAKRNNDIIYPLYCYQHSGIVLSLSPFSCPWDSGQVGIIIVNKQKAIEEYGKKIFTKQIRDKVFNYIKGEVETYNQYLSGDVYGYNTIDKDGEDVDSCWGYYGQEICIEEAKSLVDYYVEQDIKEHCEKVKSKIKGKVPIIYR